MVRAIELASRGHDVHVACLDVGQPPVSDPGVTVHVLPNLGARVPALYPTADRPLALPVPDPYVTRGLSRLVGSVRPDVVHAHNWIINSYLPLGAARRLPLVYSLHDYSHVCPTKRLMYLDAEPCTGPGARKCFTCTTQWYGAGRGPVIEGMVFAGRPVRNRVVDVFTPVSTYVGEANRLAEQGVRWQVVPNFVPDALLSASPPRDPALPAGDYLFFAGDLSRQKGVDTLLAALFSVRAGRLAETDSPLAHWTIADEQDFDREWRWIAAYATWRAAMMVFAFAVMMVFLVLAAQYESWSLPLAVILVVPMCLLSSVIGVNIAKMDINIFTRIGFVVLVGLASKNAILIVEFAKQKREAGMGRREAVVEMYLNVEAS